MTAVNSAQHDSNGDNGEHWDDTPIETPYMARLRGAETVTVGIQPEVAYALVQLPRPLEVHTA